MEQIARLYEDANGRLVLTDLNRRFWLVEDRAGAGTGMADIAAAAAADYGAWSRVEVPDGSVLRHYRLVAEMNGVIGGSARLLVHFDRLRWQGKAYLGFVGREEMEADAATPQLVARNAPGHWNTADSCITYDEDGMPIPGTECVDADFREHMELEMASMAELQAEGWVWHTPAADGAAYYLVVSLRPLRLAHIPHLDGWHAPDAMIRGLRPYEVEESTAHDKRIAEAFRRRDAARADSAS